MEDEKRFITAHEIAKMLSISDAYGSKIIRDLNDELREKGYMTIPRRVNRKYFYERFYDPEEEQEEE
ncbi:MAG: LysR family transcriptional regulator [Clostridia bacterium]|nr:LysR family transcriptional regulator [Clostridia bacterium]